MLTADEGGYQDGLLARLGVLEDGEDGAPRGRSQVDALAVPLKKQSAADERPRVEGCRVDRGEHEVPETTHADIGEV